MRVNRGQELVMGGYTIGSPFDALIFGCAFEFPRVNVQNFQALRQGTFTAVARRTRARK
jgi:hypothetical protein